MNDVVALRCEAVTVQFGALKAIDNLSYDFRRGGLYGLIGPNGAGKTTLLNVLAGRLMQSTGRILCGALDITRMPPHRRAAQGIGRSFQITKIFPDMTVLENLRIAAQVAQPRFMPLWPSRSYDRHLAGPIDAMLDTTGLALHRDEVAGTLSYGLQRALELGVTLLPNPPILLLDEPLAGVGHHEIDAATRLIQQASAGRTVLLIEHNMDVVMRLSERIVVMAQGRIIADGPPERIRNDPLVRSVYLGEDDADEPQGTEVIA
ncbi:MAG: ABC transporter ATP-binding protein [Comamonadaceae bacterium]|nr:MAG: ABC transporter ATP-binding protein [Comamonadaceae bacterium]